jgi:glycosyltransferase involved in cell wall biosynthesis
MRIAILHSQYRSGSLSGENRVVGDELSLLRSAGHDVVSWCPVPGGRSAGALVGLGIQSVWSRRAVEEVDTILREFRPDVFHVHNLFPMLSPAILTVGEKAPLVMTLHNYRLLCLPATFLRDGRACELCLGRIPWRGVLYRCYRSSIAGSAALATSLTLHRMTGSFDRVALLLAVSEHVRARHVQAGISPHVIRVKPHFAPLTERRRGPGDYFLYVGRLSVEKGPDFLVRTWKPSWGDLVIVGDGPQANLSTSRARPSITFLGAVAPSEVSQLLEHARCLLVPSQAPEAFGRSVIEAYAAGVPVVANGVGALPELVRDNASGLLVRPGNTGDWAEAIERLLEDRESERLGQGAYRLWQQQYTPERGLENLESAYREAIRRWLSARPGSG